MKPSDQFSFFKSLSLVALSTEDTHILEPYITELEESQRFPQELFFSWKLFLPPFRLPELSPPGFFSHLRLRPPWDSLSKSFLSRYTGGGITGVCQAWLGVVKSSQATHHNEIAGYIAV